MKQIKTIITIFLLLAISLPGIAQQKYSKVKITPPQDKQERAALLGLLEIDHFDMLDGAIIAEIDAEKLFLLQRTSFQYEILVADVAAFVSELNRQYFAASPSARAAMEQPGGTVSSIIATPAA